MRPMTRFIENDFWVGAAVMYVKRTKRSPQSEMEVNMPLRKRRVSCYSGEREGEVDIWEYFECVGVVKFILLSLSILNSCVC